MSQAPTIPVGALDGLRPSTQGQYQRIFRWLCAEYTGTWERTEPLQQWVDAHPSPAVHAGLRGRVVQCLVNRHIVPRPLGPPLTVHMRARRRFPGKSKVGRPRESEAPLSWVEYVPQGMRPALLENQGPTWREWLHDYVVHVLRANPLRRNLVRTYVAHVHNVLLRALGCRTANEVLSLQRTELAVAVLSANPGHPHQRRLCRIAINHFLGGVVLRDAPPMAQRLHLRTRDLPVAGGGGGGHPADYALSDTRSAPARDHFTVAEMEAILSLPGLSVRDRLMLRIMSETGLRRRAVSWLLVDAIFVRLSFQVV